MSHFESCFSYIVIYKEIQHGTEQKLKRVVKKLYTSIVKRTDNMISIIWSGKTNADRNYCKNAPCFCP